MTNAGDGSGDLYAVEQAGRIYQAVTSGESVPESPWLDISDRISSGGERGLLGLAFHPDFASNGRFFVDYTDADGNSVDLRVHALRPTDRWTRPSERVLLQVDQPFANHNGGMLAFGPDGYLYIGMGDGGSGGDPMRQRPEPARRCSARSCASTSTRATPYAIPPDNPFAAAAQRPGPRSGIAACATRGASRFDRESGGLFIGDVGQDQTEEVDVERAGQRRPQLRLEHHGRRPLLQRDDRATRPDLTLPVRDYPHDDEGCAIIGGYVYRGSRLPALDGQLLLRATTAPARSGRLMRLRRWPARPVRPARL